ncbi:MAG: hypothetical protein ACWA6X_08900 [Bauldia sp.]
MSARGSTPITTRIGRKARRTVDRWRALVRARTAYPRWRDRQLAAEWPAIDLRFGAGSDVVVGVATGYSYETLLPFVGTLRTWSNCRALLLVDDRSLAARLAADEIDTVIWKRGPGYSPHTNFARIGALLGALRAVRGISRAFLVDTRDVVFQSDPFSQIADDRLRFFTEANGQTFGRDRTNRHWLVTALGEQSPALFGDFDIVCSGTVVGGVAALIEYCRLKLFLGGMFDATRHLGSGLDQLTTNLVARFDMLPAVVMPFDGPVATPCYFNDGTLLQGPDGAFRFGNGVAPSIIHQWDRSGPMWTWYTGPDAQRRFRERAR